MTEPLPTRYETRGAVAIVFMDSPPVNALSAALRLGIATGLAKAAADPAVKAVVLVGAGKVYSGGADIKEFGTPKALSEPNLLTLIKMQDEMTKPVVSAIAGVAMGGGLELAMGSHYRVAAPRAQIALPEIKLGILPGAGGTQRLPRLIGVEKALDMILKGDPVPSEKLAGTALIDQMIEGDLVAGAVAFAEKVVAEGGKLKRARDIRIDLPNADGFFAFVRGGIAPFAKHLPGPGKVVDSVAAAVTKPFDEGMKLEREAFLHLVMTPQSRGLRHAFFAERAAEKIPDVPAETPTRPIKKAAVIGAGTMGGGISMNFANAGIPVTILETSQEALDRGLGVVRKNYEGSAKRGRMSMADVETRMGLLKPSLNYTDIADADIVIEAVFEDLGVKEKVFRQLDQVMKQGAILASNTSTLDVDAIAGFTNRPADVIGLHFFSPANVMKLLEVVRGAKTGKDVLATAMKMAKTIKKTAVVSGVCDGFIGNRMLERYNQQATFLLDEGALPWDIDKALEDFGWAMGIFRVGDLAGNDIGWKIRQRRKIERPNFLYSGIPDKICEKGRYGQKTGAGWYRYEPGKRDAIPDPEVEKIIVEHSKAIGVTRRKISRDEIVDRCMFALVNEGAKILAEGIAMRASDIDLVYLTGYGFPAFRGGPMMHADTVGLFNVVEAMKRFARNPHGEPSFWEPAPLLADLAAKGGTFN